MATAYSLNSSESENEEIRYSEGYTPQDDSNIPSPNSIIGTDERVKVTNTTAHPYRMVSRVVCSYYNVLYEGKYYTLTGTGTAFLEGPDFLVTAGHVIWGDPTTGDFDDGINNPKFPDKIYIEPATYKDSSGIQQYPYGRIPVTQLYIQKEYYLNRTFDYDWGVCVIGIDLGYETGWFGKSCNNTFTNYDADIVGYPGDRSPNMYLAEGQIQSTSTYRYTHNIDTTGGNSGSPVSITKSNGGTYVCAIHTSGASSSNGATKINSFIFDFLNSLLPTNGVEVKNFYYEGSTYHRYNCAGEQILCPPDNSYLVASSDGINFTRKIYSRTQYFSYPLVGSTKFSFVNTYFKLFNTVTETYSDVISLSSRYNEYDMSCEYPVKGFSKRYSMISTSFDQSGNLWTHGGSTSQTIKGTIVYAGLARNIEVSIPWIGTKTSATVTFKGVTFQLRCGPNKVSIKASKVVATEPYSCFFAFAVV